MATEVKCIMIPVDDDSEEPCAYVLKRTDKDIVLWDVYAVDEAGANLLWRATFVDDREAAVEFAEENHC